MNKLIFLLLLIINNLLINFNNYKKIQNKDKNKKNNDTNDIFIIESNFKIYS